MYNSKLTSLHDEQCSGLNNSFNNIMIIIFLACVLITWFIDQSLMVEFDFAVSKY